MSHQPAIEAFRAHVARLPDAVQTALKAAARESAERIRADYAERLNRQLKPGHTGKTAASAKVVDESDHHQYVVAVPGDPDRPANLPLWLEFGTRFMAAKPALRPAGRAESPHYIARMTHAAETAAIQTFPGATVAA